MEQYRRPSGSPKLFLELFSTYGEDITQESNGRFVSILKIRIVFKPDRAERIVSYNVVMGPILSDLSSALENITYHITLSGHAYLSIIKS
jgi:hypothetical protein